MSLRFRSAVVVLTSLAALLLPSSASAVAECSTVTVTKHWVGGGATTEWSDAANWFGGAVPAGSDVACIPAGATATLLSAATAQTVVVEGTLRIQGGSMSTTTLLVGTLGQVFQDDAAFTVNGGTLVDNRGTWTSNGSTLYGTSGVFNNLGTYRVLTSAGLSVQPVFNNAGVFELVATDSGYVNLYSGTHTGDFDIQGSAAGSIRFFSNNALDGGALRTSASGAGYTNVGALSISSLELDTRLTLAAGTVTMGATPFDAASSSNALLRYEGSSVVGSFTLPAGWTFDQRTTFYVPAAATVTNAGTWLTEFPIYAGDAESKFVNLASFTATTSGGIGTSVEFDNGSTGTYTLNATGDNAYTTLSAHGTHAGRFVVGGTGANARIRFYGGTHSLGGVTLERTNGTGSFTFETTVGYTDVELDAPLRFVSGQFTPATTPFDVDESDVTSLVYQGGSFLSGFTVPSDWTFDQQTTFYVPASSTVTNAGTWLTDYPIYAGDANSKFVNTANFTGTTSGGLGINVPFDNVAAGTFTLVATGDHAYAVLGASGTHAGRFVVAGAGANARIRFYGGTHSLTGASLERTNGTGSFAFETTIGLDGVKQHVPLTWSSGTITPGNTPFDEVASTNHSLTYTGGSLVGSFTVPSAWTFNQQTTFYVPAGSTVTNNGTWLTDFPMYAGDSNSKFVNNAAFTGTTNGGLGVGVAFDNATNGVFTLDATGDNAYVTFSASGTHTGRFVITGTGANARIRFFSGTHALNGASLERTNATGSFAFESTISMQAVKQHVPLAWTSGTITPGNTPFDELVSTNHSLTYGGATLVGNFTLPEDWTLDQTTTFYVPAGATVTNEGTWTTDFPIHAGDAASRFINSGSMVGRSSGGLTVSVPFDNTGLYTFTATGDNASVNFSANGTHTGRFVVGGAGANARIRFYGGTHALDGSELDRSNATGSYALETTATLGSIVVHAMLDAASGAAISGDVALSGTGTLRTTTTRLGTAGSLTVGTGVTLAPIGSVNLGGRLVTVDGTLLLDGAGSFAGVEAIELDGTLERTGAGTYTIVPDLQTVQLSRVEVSGGVLSLATSNGAADTIGDGVWTITNDADVVLSSPTTGIDGAVELDGGGSTVSATNSIASVDGALTTKNASSVSLVDSSTINGFLFAEGSGSISANDLLLADGAVAAGDGALILGGTTTVASGARLDLSIGTRTIDDLSNDGEVTLLHGDVAISGSFAQSATGELEVSLDETEGGSLAAADSTLNGWLKLNVEDMAGAPAYDVEHALLTTTGITTGAFDDFSYVAEDLDAPRLLELTYDDHSVSSVITETVAPGALDAATSTSPAVDDVTVASAITATWPAATDDDSGIAGYNVQLTGGDPAFQTATTATFSDLSPGTYEVFVQAVDHEGNESPTRAYGPFKLTAAPSVGTLVSSTPAVSTSTVGTSVTATWNAAAPTGIAIVGYRRAISTTQGATPTGDATNTTTATFSSLAAGTYWVNVVAVDADGNTSAVRSFGPFVLTTVPTVGTLASSTPAVSTPTVATTVTATWNAAAPTGIAIVGYRRAISTTQGATPTGDATNSTTATFSSLAAGTYWVNVVAVDADGNASAVRSFGPFVLTDPAPVVTDPTPPAPTPPAPTPPAPTPPTDTIAPKVGIVRNPTITPTGVVTLKVPACPAGETTCAGSVKLESKVAPSTLRAKLVNFVLGTAKFTAKGGQTATVKIKLSAKAKKVLKKAKVLKVVTTITVTDAAGNKTVVKKTLTLRAPKKLR